MERFLTLFWLFLIPTQLGRHFWLKESSVLGARVDYLSIILYLTDIVWFLWVISKRKDFRFKILKEKIFSFKNFMLLLFVVVNIIFATAKWVAVYRWLRIGQWFLTWYLVKINKKEIISGLKKVIPVWIILEVFLSLAQVINGGSLNGIWWWLGERRFTYGGIGIAQLRFFDEGWIRAYGTFSHPNSLAGFLLLSWWWWKSNLPPTPFFNKMGRWIVNWSVILGIILTGSRVIWGLTAIMLIWDQISIKSLKLHVKSKKFKRELIGKICLVLGITCLALGVISINYRVSDFVGGWDINSWNKREMLGLSAVKTIEKSPLFGVGAGNFVVNLPKYQSGNFYWMQPVHNVFLLIWSEIGMLGIIGIGVFLTTNNSFQILRLVNRKYWWILAIVGVSGMFDHYWITLPQNTWLLALILGLI